MLFLRAVIIGPRIAYAINDDYFALIFESMHSKNAV